MPKTHHLNHRQALVYGVTLLPVNTFFKLYLRDQERAQQKANRRQGMAGDQAGKNSSPS
ncbi:hypothetical protein [Limosilactobacillus pontis]|uniref:hypothetical protein n=1 Tax=Limosilactobacillus pontis TaxID=35787 RepID=UPI00242004FF|nr:hypothetical protein [Limosilactobacillus pontis]